MQIKSRALYLALVMIITYTGWSARSADESVKPDVYFSYQDNGMEIGDRLEYRHVEVCADQDA
jgi:hypothetical protein